MCKLKSIMLCTYFSIVPERSKWGLTLAVISLTADCRRIYKKEKQMIEISGAKMTEIYLADWVLFLAEIKKICEVNAWE